MQPLSPEELQASDRRIEAAVGYLGLGMPADAWNELEQIVPEHRSQVPVLKVRVDVCRALESWELMAELSGRLIRLQPNEYKHTDDLAYALRQLKGAEEADAILGRRLADDPDNAFLVYKLGCLEFLRSGMDAARPTMQRAFALDSSLKGVALEDPDLQGFWEDLCGSSAED
jgi:hypothetical protein